jgi:hypothetical protein
MLTGYYSSKDYPDKLRRAGYRGENGAANNIVRFHHRVNNEKYWFNFQLKQQALESVRHKMVNP